MRSITFRHLGRIKYKDALKLQLSHVEDLKNKDGGQVVLTLEHEPVYTVGIRSQDYDSGMEKALVSRTGAEFVRTNRGGLITFHGPGQLVAYPILDLKEFTTQRKALLGVKWYVDRLEESVIRTCRSLGIPHPCRSPHTGVWVGDNKICAMGVRNSGFITYHGLALNTNIDLSWFKEIVPCGILDKGVTSVSQELGVNLSPLDVLPVFTREFKAVFGQ